MENNNNTTEEVKDENAEAKMPDGVKMNIKYARVLLEFLVCGTPEDKTRIKKMTTKMQEQMENFKGGKKARILYNMDGDKTEDERKAWLIENANAKYYVFTPENFSISNTYVRDTLLTIKKFELYFDMLKQKGICIAKKPVLGQANTVTDTVEIRKEASPLSIVKDENPNENND